MQELYSVLLFPYKTQAPSCLDELEPPDGGPPKHHGRVEVVDRSRDTPPAIAQPGMSLQCCVGQDRDRVTAQNACEKVLDII